MPKGLSMAMKKRSRSCTGLLLMNADSRAQYSMPSGGIVSIFGPDIETALFGLGLSRSLHG